jgi:hypothetical protein
MSSVVLPGNIIDNAQLAVETWTDVILCKTVYLPLVNPTVRTAQLTYRPIDRGIKHIRNISKRLLAYTALQPRRQSSSYSPPWEPEILQQLNSFLRFCRWQNQVFCAQSETSGAPVIITSWVCLSVRAHKATRERIKASSWNSIL